MPRILAVANRKGGVGKTTTTVNVATAMAAAGKKVLVIDLDPQGNASTSMGINKKGRMSSSYEVLLGEKKLSEAVVWTEIPNFSLVPSSPDLAGAEVELVDVEGREFALKKALAKDAVNYDYILIDCPPSLSLVTINALVAADAVIVPLQCEFLALEGVTDLIRNINQIKKVFNPSLALHGVVLTMYDKRNNLSQMVEDDVRSFFGKKVYNTVIPRNVRISEAPSHGKPVLLYDFKCPGSQAYISLAGEVLKTSGFLLGSIVRLEYEVDGKVQEYTYNHQFTHIVNPYETFAKYFDGIDFTQYYEVFYNPCILGIKS